VKKVIKVDGTAREFVLEDGTRIDFDEYKRQSGVVQPDPIQPPLIIPAVERNPVKNAGEGKKKWAR
jgi:hypothetical protein